ncbi:hypothetical protein AB0D08_14065 [Kitasatospora sp. NPDC048540]|uniref:hypothetical protein n=1 Tax=unclassified Kitasatospora TaxID=2633591 RepID=UPI00053A3A5A|nr:hypothetical protein [Kitasatospora sp. MBT63]
MPRPTAGPSATRRLPCPNCRTEVPAHHLDRDLKVCPACRQELRRGTCAWLQQLAGLAVLGPVLETGSRTDLPIAPAS